MAEAALIGTATAAAKAVAQLVAARALDESKLAWGFKGELEKLSQKFEYIQAFLEDASNSKYATKSQLVDLWVQKVKTAAYIADNVIDEYAIEIFRRKMELKNPMDELCNFFTPYNPILFHISMAHKVKEILSLFDEIDKDAKDIGLNRVDIAATSVIHTSRYDHDLSQTRQHPFTSDSEFIGRENDQSELLDFMCSQDRLLSTVAIVGMGGMGKTTLARHLYDHEKVDDHFGKKIWICVSENFEVVRLLNEMIESVTSCKSELSNMDAIIRKVQEVLDGKKLLLVLDDVWNDNERLWGCLQRWLRKTAIASGSVILTTTRSVEVAQAAGTVYKRKLKVLSNDDSWSLLRRIVFADSTSQRFSHLEEVGRRIAVNKCKGVPLAIKVIGGLLKSKQDYEWPKIESSEIWDLSQGQHQILPSLLLSFNHLPSPSLKQCFAYCGLLYKGTYMSKSELIGFWLSQGYLCENERENMTTEEIGEKYLNILLNNSLLEEFVKEGHEHVYYWMHDLVLDLAVFVCGQDLILEVRKLRESGGRCRHLLYSGAESRMASEFPPEKAFTGLRTILFKGGSIPWQLLSHTRDLRTLFLSYGDIIEVPQSIELLKHLRFLDLSHNPISTLPETFGKLYQLQSLILQGCINMKKLPKVVNQLVNLRHIFTTAPMSAWKGLQKLTNLRSLPCLSLDDDAEGWTIDELGDLHELRDVIHIQGLQCVKDTEQAKKADIAGKPNFLKLTLCWAEGREEKFGGLSSAGIQMFVDEVPSWISWMLAYEANLAGNNNFVELIMCWLNETEEIGRDNHDEDVVDYQYLRKSSVELLNFIDELPSWMSWMLVQKNYFDKAVFSTNGRPRFITGICQKDVLDCHEPHLHVASRTIFLALMEFIFWLREINDLGHHHRMIDVTSPESKCFIDQFFSRINKMVHLKSRLNDKNNRLEETICLPDERGTDSENYNDKEILECLEPHTNITSLEVRNFMGVQFPTWVKDMVVQTKGLNVNPVQLHNLTKVKLLNCSRCQTLPKLGLLPSLECLIMSGLCVKFIDMEFYGGDRLDMPEVVSFKCLKELEISKFSRLSTWMQPPKGAFPNLETLRIRNCTLLKSVPALEIESLMTLELKNLHSVESLDIIKYSSALISFIMEWLPKIVSLPQELANCTKLQILHITGAHRLLHLPNGLESLVCLKSVLLNQCSVISFVMDDLLQVCSSLRFFEISKCRWFKKIPSGLEECSLLESLKLNRCPMIEGSPTDISKMRRLLILRIKYSSAKHLRSVLESAKGHRFLKGLEIEGFADENELNDYFSYMTPFHNLPSLTNLVLTGQPNIKTLPEQLGRLTGITYLGIQLFDDLERIPAWISNLSSLSDLELSHCKNLKYLPSKEDLKLVDSLKIESCPLLVKRCTTKDDAPEWQNISHIRIVKINDKVIQYLY